MSDTKYRVYGTLVTHNLDGKHRTQVEIVAQTSQHYVVRALTPTAGAGVTMEPLDAAIVAKDAVIDVHHHAVARRHEPRQAQEQGQGFGL